MGSLIYWLVGRAWQFRASVPDWSNVQEIQLKDLGLAGGFETKFLRGMGAVF